MVQQHTHQRLSGRKETATTPQTSVLCDHHVTDTVLCKNDPDMQHNGLALSDSTTSARAGCDSTTGTEADVGMLRAEERLRPSSVVSDVGKGNNGKVRVAPLAEGVDSRLGEWRRFVGVRRCSNF